ncbi:MAG TPA: DUF4159 domain-containing protein [Vicinamibacterales bacterium]|nr:DUF4159 domain-containing protein [Vicinamibacterales bacterium]
MFHLRRVGGIALLAGLLLAAGPTLASLAVAQMTHGADDRFAGLQWTFARIKYNASTGDARTNLRVGYWEEPWAIDAPAAEQNLTRRLSTVTAIQVTDPVVITFDDDKIWQYPWLYIVEPSNLSLSDREASTLREHLLRGGTLTLDDFHGPYEWDLTVKQLKLVFPDREIVEIEPPHPIYTCFYQLEKYPQVPGLGSFFSGRSWEKGGFVPRLRGILDDAGRPMVLINWNTDMGDGMEWSNAEDYPGYLKWTAQAYQMMINEVIYTLTH